MIVKTHLPLILAAATLSLACGSSATPEGAAETGEKPTLEERPLENRVTSDDDPAGDWVLVALGEETGFEPPITLAVDPVEGKIAGHSACNRYFSSWNAEDGKVELGMTGSTMMACPEPVMELEGRYFEALEKVAGYRMSGEELELTDEEGEPLLRFARSEPSTD